ncbi:glycerol kinase GlpK [Frankia sp. AgW1.1]|uniref:glycerol kinase GlpK n=1 Tax=Frankia sp. AgW1.1 TaxID=1836971 RepID=UPI001932DF2E|nr:glycerol kinase GlpK [Frankia sp. AgW1.1]MBL7491683.1 glycerol kinase GlpK [Frankia sp. AgW1.1]
MPEPVVVAVDQGTTGTTVCVLDQSAHVVGRAQTEVTVTYPRPGWVEQDPEQLWGGVVATVSAALGAAGRTPADIAAVGITNQRETTVVWDRRTGRPVAPAIVWQDRRTSSACERLAAAGHGPEVAERTGLVLDPYFSGTKIAWLLADDPELARRAGRGELAFGTVDTWLIWRLTGGRTHVTDVTNASRTLLLDLADASWSAPMAELLGVPMELLAEVRPSSEVYAETDPATFLGVSVPVAAAVGDQQAALFAQACFAPGQAKNTYGTGSFVLLNTGPTPPPPRRDGALLRTVAFQLAGEPVHYALEGAVLATGSAVQWLRDGLGVVGSAAETAQLAGSLTGNDGVYFVPALAGLGAPHWDPRARGTLVGLTRGTGRAHLARAVLESIAYRTRDIVEAMTAAGTPVTELRADGGAAANPWLMQFQADILGIPVDVPDNLETTALGSGYLAGLATGVFPDRAALAGLRRTAARYEPVLAPATRDSLYADWLRALDRSRDWARD